MDKVLALQNGNQTAFGPRDQVMAQMAVRRPPPMPTTATKDMPPLHATLKVVGDAES